MAPDAKTELPAAARPGALRAALLGLSGVGIALALILLAYQLALARVPQHRAALERLVRAETGLDIRFDQLGLRWGWYGPEAVFRRVELDEPGSSEALLRAPELVVGFDAWRTLRSGHPEAGRIELVAPDIDLAGRPGLARIAAGAPGVAREAAGVPALYRVAVLQRWRGGRIDIEGGTLRLPGYDGTAGPFTLQMRRASLRRSDEEWSAFALVLLPERVGRTARIVLRLTGELARPAALSGSLRLEAQRLLFPGCRELLAGMPRLVRYLPRAGSGDLTADIDFEQGRIVQAGGKLRAAGLVLDAPDSPLAGADSPPARTHSLLLSRVRGDWRAVRRARGWRFDLESLDLAKGAPVAAGTVEVGEADEPVGRAPRSWVRGHLEQAPLDPLIAVARWLLPGLNLADVALGGTAHSVTFDWSSARPAGERLQASARLEDIELSPQSRDFTLSGLNAQIAGNETQLTIDVQSRAGRLELARSPQYPLSNLRVSSTLRVRSGAAGWRLATDEFLLEHQRARLSLRGELRGGAVQGADVFAEPDISLRGSLDGADIPFVQRLLGGNTAQAFGAVASQLTAGDIKDAQFELRGPLSELPFGRDGGFTGSLTLRDATLSGGDLWPDGRGIDARIEWHGARIQATIQAGHAGPFQLTASSAQWDAAGESATRLTGHIDGRLEEAISWIRGHPGLQEYAPAVQDLEATGAAAFDFDVSLSPRSDQTQQVQAHVSTVVTDATLEAVSGLPPMQAVTGAFVFDSGHVQPSILTGSWLGGPVRLRVGERHERGSRALSIQAQGVLNAQQLANVANATRTVQGSTEWTGELTYSPGHGSQPSRWRMRASSSLLGISSLLPEPFDKRAVSSLPVSIDVTGTDRAAQMRVTLTDRVRSAFALVRSQAGWVVDRGAVRFGPGVPAMPSESAVEIAGQIGSLDLPAYVVAWQQLRREGLPPIRARIVADKMWVAGRSYDGVALQANRDDTTTELRIDSAAIAGIARWPTAPGAHQSTLETASPVEFRLSRLEVPYGSLPFEGLGLIAALGPTVLVSVDELSWRGRLLGRLTATVGTQSDVLVMDDVRLVNDEHDVHGDVHCETAQASPACRANFKVASRDAAATLEDFGFAPELDATDAALAGELQWRPGPERAELASLRGTLSMRLADGAVHELDGSGHGQSPLGLFAIPALMSGLNEPGAAGAPLVRQHSELRFSQLEADFDVHDGDATTSDLHFDGDAEILMRGRTGLAARDYDQQVWVLRGEDRLPAAVRRFGATPRVAAVWLSLRDLVSGAGPDRAGAALRLQGSWDDPIVVAAK